MCKVPSAPGAGPGCIPGIENTKGSRSDKIVVGGAHGPRTAGPELSQALLPAADSHGHTDLLSKIILNHGYDFLPKAAYLFPVVPIPSVDITNTRLFSSRRTRQL